MAYYKKRRPRIKPRFFVILGVLAALLIWGISALVQRVSAPTVQWGGLETDRNVAAIVIRDEQVVRSSSYARINCLVAEGEQVEAGTPVAELYTSGYSEKDVQNLISLEKTIKEYQQNNILKNIVDEQLEGYNSSISQKLEEISQATVSSKLQNLLVLERELSQLMQQRQAYMKQIVTPDDHLNSLYQQQSDLEAKIAANKQVLALNESAAVSFFIDGYEDLLNAGNLDQITVENIEKANKDIASYGDFPGQSNGPVGANEPLLRAVNNSHWYMAFTLPSKENSLVEGTTCEMTLEGYNDTLISANVSKVKVDGKTALVILEIPQTPGAMLRLRKVSAHIGRNAEGFKVPLGAIRGGDTVTVVTDQGQVDVKIEIVASNNAYAIIRQADGGSTLAINQKLVMAS